MNRIDELNESFEQEYGYSLGTAMDKLLDGIITIDEVVESDEFYEYMNLVPHITWKELEQQIEAEARAREAEEYDDADAILNYYN